MSQVFELSSPWHLSFLMMSLHQDQWSLSDSTPGHTEEFVKEQKMCMLGYKGEEENMGKGVEAGQRIFFHESELYAHHSLSGPTLTHPCDTAAKVQKSADDSLTDPRQQAGGRHKVYQLPNRVPSVIP